MICVGSQGHSLQLYRRILSSISICCKVSCTLPVFDQLSGITMGQGALRAAPGGGAKLALSVKYYATEIVLLNSIIQYIKFKISTIWFSVENVARI